jgi:hypothetical protein
MPFHDARRRCRIPRLQRMLHGLLNLALMLKPRAGPGVQGLDDFRIQTPAQLILQEFLK